jgi:asparagine synthase (glutamine-hydrolysing)
MCGITAVFRRDGAPVLADEVVAMRDALAHRGPDDCGTFVDGPVGLGHRRLRIIDLDGGAQPMANGRGTVQIVFNGEIYNYRELRAMLLGRGVQLRTQSDTETILGLYDLYGSECVNYLRGMFAFVLWDAERRTLVAARDRLGIKPLYVFRRGSTIAFASEMKAFFPLREWRAALRSETVAEYLIYRNLAGTRTIFQDVERVPPGEVVELTARDERHHRYWSLPMPVVHAERARPAAEWAEEFEALLGETVRQHMVSDVPLGTFLSGGVDSSLVTALAVPAATGPLHTFSVGFAEEDFDERPYALAVAERLGTRHEAFVISARDYEDWLPSAVWHADEPLAHPHMVHFHYLSKFARRQVTVVLTGEGSDELFAGYPRYRALRVLERLRLPTSLLGGVLGLASRGLKGRGGLRVRALMDGGAGLRIEGLAAFVDPAEVRALVPLAPRLAAREAAGGAHGSLLARALLLDQQTYLDVLLHRLDKMTMSTSLEARVPFLDHHVVEFAARVPLELKLRGFDTKYLVKQVARRHVPANVIDRPKKGFGVPIARWLMPGGPLAPYADLLLEPRARTADYVDRARVRRAVEEHRAGTRDHGELLWGLLNLELWHRVMLEGRRPPTGALRAAAPLARLG